MLKRILIVVVAIICALSCGRIEILTDSPKDEKVTPDPQDDDADDVDWAKAVAYVFDDTIIPEIHITVTKEEWERLLALYDQDHDTQEYIHCNVKYRKDKDVVYVEDAGLRLKGNTSRRRPYDGGKYHHAHFGLDFHQYEKDPQHTVKGLRKVDLKWFKDDPAYVREIFCYDLFRREDVWTAVRDVYSRLWIKVGDEKEVYFGVYGMMEHIDKNYLRIRKNQFKDVKGNLWKCSWGANLKNKYASMGVDNDKTKFTYELKTNKAEGFQAAKTQLQDFISHVSSLEGNDFNTWITQHMDIGLFLKTYAVNVAVGMWDDYWNNTNNYYLYFTSSADSYKVWFIPYDYDNTLGTTVQCGVQSDAGRHDPLKWGSDDCPLVSKILMNAHWKSMYVHYLKDMCRSGGSFHWEESVERIRKWQGSVNYYVNNDTGEDMEIKDKPASWSNHKEYRLLEDSSSNFFKVKAEVVDKMSI